MNTFLETGISLVLIFFIFSIITYVIQELIAVNMKYRGKMLWKSMSQLMDGFVLEGRMKLMKPVPAGKPATTNTDDFYGHAEIKSLQKNLNRLPNYIPAANFALAIMDLVAQKAPTKAGVLFTDFQAGLQSFVNSNGDLYKVLKNLADTSANVQELQKKIEDWFNNYMHRVTGWYESHTVVSVRLIAVAITLIFNINVIKLAKIIYSDGKLRNSMVAMSETVVDNSKPITQFYTTTFEKENADKTAAFKARIDSAKGEEKKSIENERDSVMAALAKNYTQKNIAAIQSLTSSLDTTGLPLGWKSNTFCKEITGKKGSSAIINFLLMLAGWLIGAGCISMGAPFWFDMLNKLVNVRRSGVKPGK
ncbi:hypothetical protein [Ferruginibacter sp. SUN106]|uniref:hypothetical protein n=1 Tax=Ferruginibacter sp. SUN106 TaxID=2978348 RepID=UPI003D35BE17